jgi:hypothetical protein
MLFNTFLKKVGENQTIKIKITKKQREKRERKRNIPLSSP